MPIVLLWVKYPQEFILTLLRPHLCGSVLWLSCNLLLLPLQCGDPGEYLYYMAIQNLVYKYRNIHLNIANIKAPPMHFSLSNPIKGPQSNLSQMALIELKDQHMHLYGITPSCIGLFHYTEPYYIMDHCLKLRHIQYTDVSIMSQEG